MTEKSQPDLHEQLSALVDGETTDWELRKVLQQATADPLFNQRWHAYQRISSALRHDATGGVDISQAVSALLAGEKAGVAGWLITARKPLAQTAIAASVATFAVVGVQQYQLATLAPVEADFEVAATPNYGMTAPLQLPEGFSLPNITTQNVSSTNFTTPAATPVQMLSVQVPVFDRDELKAHLESSLNNHSFNAAEASQLIIPRARTSQSPE